MLDDVLIIDKTGNDRDRVAVWGPTGRDAEAKFDAITRWAVILMERDVM